jgi:hypothetical protein
MFRKMMLLAGCALTLSISALAGKANAQDQMRIKITDVRQSASCGPAETDCVDVTWTVINASPQTVIGGFEVTVKVFYSEAGSQTDSLTVRGAAVRKAKVPVFHGGSGSLKSYEVTVKAFPRVGNKTIATGARSGTF